MASAALLLVSVFAVPAAPASARAPANVHASLGVGLPGGLGGGFPLPGVGGGVLPIGGGLPLPGGGGGGLLPPLPGGLPLPGGGGGVLPPNPVTVPPVTLPPVPGGGTVDPPVTDPVTPPKKDPKPKSDEPRQPATDQKQAPGGTSSTPVAAPPVTPPQSVGLQPPVARTTGTGRIRQSAGHKAKRTDARAPGAGAKKSFGLNGFHRETSQPAPTQAPHRLARPNSTLARVLERIPPQYRWPVFVLACIATFLGFNSVRERRRSLRIESQALVDSLTGLANRRAFERRLAKEYKRADRYDRPLGMLLLDLDGFKQINDTKGHAAGDDVLREAAAAISRRIRQGDFAARLGGDEFVVLCPETSQAGAKELARSLEEHLAEASIRTSIGVAEREPEDDGVAEYLVARADAAMYRRKQRSGGGRERRSNRLAHGTPATSLVGA
jgi:diguanylate cyclase (GGDEF)-like protein